MQATLTSRRDHNFRVNNRKENRVYNNKLITLYERIDDLSSVQYMRIPQNHTHLIYLPQKHTHCVKSARASKSHSPMVQSRA